MAAAPDEVTAGIGWFVAPPGPPRTTSSEETRRVQAFSSVASMV